MEKKRNWGKILVAGLAVAGVACAASYLTYRLYCETQDLYDEDEFDDLSEPFLDEWDEDEGLDDLAVLDGDDEELDEGSNEALDAE